MASMFSLGNITLPGFLTFGNSVSPARSIKLAPVTTVDIETGTERRKRRLKHLIKANHTNFSVIYHNLQFHNHNVHILGSAYLFDSTPEHLNDIYDAEAKSLDPWVDSPGEITVDDWREYLGKRDYQRAFIDFFEDQLVQHGYDWKKLLDTFLFSGKAPLMNNMINGLSHPLIHLGYAYELSSHTIAIEALTMGACCYNFLHKYLDDPSYTRPPKSVTPSSSPLELLQAINNDKRLDNLFDHPGGGNVEGLFRREEDVVLDYWNAWELGSSQGSDPTKQFGLSQMAAVALLVGTHDPSTGGHFDFFLVHLLTSSHAVRILLPAVPAEFQTPLVRQWWLFVVAVYTAQLRPRIDLDRINDVDLRGRDWDFVARCALEGRRGLDAHYVKALRAMREAANTWGDPESFYLRAAVRFAEGFSKWGGFGTEDEEMETAENERHGD